MKREKSTARPALRPLRIRRNFTRHPEGSVLIECGNTRVLCTASVEARLPEFRKASGKGWVTAEYGMLPRSTHTRMNREAKSGQSGRTLEIARLIGRSLRAAVDLDRLGPYTITVDCDVLQADGGTRCAGITGGMVALYDALRWMKAKKMLAEIPLQELVAAVSVGIIDGQPALDLCYEQDCRAGVDMNVVMTAGGKYIEIQGTAEHAPFSETELEALRKLAAKGIGQLVAAQRKALKI